MIVGPINIQIDCSKVAEQIEELTSGLECLPYSIRDDIRSRVSNFSGNDIEFVGGEFVPAPETANQASVYRGFIRIIWLDELCTAARRARNLDIPQIDSAHV